MSIEKTSLPKTLPAPDLPANLHENAKWLAGEGAGSWFVIDQANQSNYYNVYRYSPTGMLECSGLFQTFQQLDLSKAFYITYPSHCQKVSIQQHGEILLLMNIENQ